MKIALAAAAVALAIVIAAPHPTTHTEPRGIGTHHHVTVHTVGHHKYPAPLPLTPTNP